VLGGAEVRGRSHEKNRDRAVTCGDAAITFSFA